MISTSRRTTIFPGSRRWVLRSHAHNTSTSVTSSCGRRLIRHAGFIPAGDPHKRSVICLFPPWSSRVRRYSLVRDVPTCPTVCAPVCTLHPSETLSLSRSPAPRKYVFSWTANRHTLEQMNECCQELPDYQVERLASSPSQRQCERTSFSFYCAVREQLPVWLLEDMRGMEVFCWEDGRPRAFLPCEALLYALVHDHQDYARYLLNRYSVSALRAPLCSFCCCRGSGAPHLAVAVRYDRVSILSMMVEALKDCGTHSDYLDSCGGCSHVADAGKTAVQLAVELSRPDCLLLLLVHGARPDGLDLALQKLVFSDTKERRQAQRCLDFLLLFLPKPLAQHRLQEEPQHWQSLLGKETFSWLCGLAPPPLLLQALRCLARYGPDQIAGLPDFLQPHSWQ